MSPEKAKKINRRDFLKKTGAVSLAASAATLGGISLSSAGAETEDEVVARDWQKKQKA